MKLRYLFIILFFSIPSLGYSQVLGETKAEDAKLNVYLDCRGCDENYIRNEIDFVNFVRDQSAAQIHLLITRQFTGSGGRQYTLNFIGQGLLKNQSRELYYSSIGSDTEDERRDGLVNNIKLGLLPYLTNNKVMEDIQVIYNPTEGVQSSPVKDKWNNWVFEIGGSTYFSGEESRKNLNLNGNIEIRRVTENWKTYFDYANRVNRRTFITEDSLGNKEEETFTTETQRFFGLIARSLNDHWTAGGYIRASSSTRNNYDLTLAVTPSIEYSVYPYRDYAKRQITFRYGILSSYNDYTETTIYGKDQENLFRQELEANMEFTQPWGEVETRVNAYSYLHDLSKNRVEFDFELDFRITRNLSVFLSARYSLINDQINIAAGNTTDEELLLNLRQQSTSYSYGGSVGIEVTFGSIYNNVVNPRF